MIFIIPSTRPYKAPYKLFVCVMVLGYYSNSKTPVRGIKTLLQVKHKNNRPGIEPGQCSLIQFQNFYQNLNRQQEQKQKYIHALTAFQENVKRRVSVALVYCAATPGSSRFNAVVSMRELVTAL